MVLGPIGRNLLFASAYAQFSHDLRKHAHAKEIMPGGLPEARGSCVCQVISLAMYAFSRLRGSPTPPFPYATARARIPRQRAKKKQASPIATKSSSRAMKISLIVSAPWLRVITSAFMMLASRTLRGGSMRNFIWSSTKISA